MLFLAYSYKEAAVHLEGAWEMAVYVCQNVQCKKALGIWVINANLWVAQVLLWKRNYEMHFGELECECCVWCMEGKNSSNVASKQHSDSSSVMNHWRII